MSSKPKKQMGGAKRRRGVQPHEASDSESASSPVADVVEESDTEEAVV